MCGYSTDSAAPVASAASTAEPPARSASTPAAEASECGEATMPRVAMVAGLPVVMGNTGLARSDQQPHSARHNGMHHSIVPVVATEKTLVPAATVAGVIGASAPVALIVYCKTVVASKWVT